MVVAEMRTTPEGVAVSFVRALRQAGVTVALGSAISYLQALGELDLTR